MEKNRIVCGMLAIMFVISVFAILPMNSQASETLYMSQAYENEDDFLSISKGGTGSYYFGEDDWDNFTIGLSNQKVKDGTKSLKFFAPSGPYDFYRWIEGAENNEYEQAYGMASFLKSGFDDWQRYHKIDISVWTDNPIPDSDNTQATFYCGFEMKYHAEADQNGDNPFDVDTRIRLTTDGIQFNRNTLNPINITSVKLETNAWNDIQIILDTDLERGKVIINEVSTDWIENGIKQVMNVGVSHLNGGRIDFQNIFNTRFTTPEGTFIDPFYYDSDFNIYVDKLEIWGLNQYSDDYDTGDGDTGGDTDDGGDDTPIQSITEGDVAGIPTLSVILGLPAVLVLLSWLGATGRVAELERLAVIKADWFIKYGWTIALGLTVIAIVNYVNPIL